MANHQDTPRARLLLAQGYLCRGLGDDPAALDAAIDQLGALVEADPTDANTQLDLAEAMRKRYPLSHEAESALERVQALLSHDSVGAAHDLLAAHVRDNLDAVRKARSRAAALLADVREHPGASGDASSDVRLRAHLTAQTGADGRAEAESLLEDHLLVHPNDGNAAFQLAELLRGRANAERLQRLYEAAMHYLCAENRGGSPTAECTVALRRLVTFDSPLRSKIHANATRENGP